MIRIALCDDDTVFLEEFSELVKMKFALYNCEVKVEIFTNGRALIERFEINNVAFDIVFLDINMENIDGLSTAERLRVLNTKFLLLFTTNMEGYATEGYKYEAFRYILKSKLKENLEEAIKKIIMKIKKLTTDEEQIQLKII